MNSNGSGNGLIAILVIFIIVMFGADIHPDISDYPAVYYRLGAIVSVCLIVLIIGLWRHATTLFLILGGLSAMIWVTFVTMQIEDIKKFSDIAWWTWVPMATMILFFTIACIIDTIERRKNKYSDIFGGIQKDVIWK